MTDLDPDVAAFIACVDALGERLRARRRPQDAGAAECSPRELRALSELGYRGQLTMTDLAKVLDVPLSTATRTVERLLGKGLVERRRAARDRRVVEVRFGRRGKRINQHVIDSRGTAARALLERLPRRERAQLVKQLARLVDGSATIGAKR